MQMYLLLTDACNLNCSFCIRGEHAHVKNMDVQDLSTVLSINDFRNYDLILTGGEPTLHKDMLKIVEICDGKFKRISINTNGIKSHWIEKLDFNASVSVQISLDGTRECHNRMRGNGKIDLYEKILQTIRALNRKKVSYCISTTVGHANYDNIKELCKQMDSFANLHYWKVSPLLPYGCASANESIDVASWNRLVEFLLDNSNVSLKIHKLFDFSLIEKYIKRTGKVVNSLLTNCGCAKYKVYVYPDFMVYPCTCLTDFPLGNLLINTLPEILQNNISKQFSNYVLCNESNCAKCRYLPFCNGGCVGMSYLHFGKIGMGDYRCPLLNGVKQV